MTWTSAPLTCNNLYDRIVDMKKPTREEFIARLEKDAPEWELLGEYNGALVQTMFRHKPCGTEYMKTPYNVTLKPHSCRTCNAKRLAFTPGKYRESIAHKTDYKLLTDFVDAKTKVKVRHKICGTEFKTLPFNFNRREEGCPHCKGRAISKSTSMAHGEFLKKLGERAGGYEFVTEYQNMYAPVTVIHRCGNKFDVKPVNLLRGSRCQSCKYSTGEGEVYKFVQGLHLDGEVVQGDRTHLSHGRELDIWAPAYNVAIEYDGVQFHSQKGLMRSHPTFTMAQAKNYHLWKTRECEKQGIRLIHIFEDEWVEHREIVEDKLRAAFKCPMKRYFARKLELKPVGVKEAKKFLDANHIQGWGRASASIGLYDGEELVAVQSFLKKGEGKWELVRYATSLGSQVVGGFTKCLKWFEREYRPREVVSFGDRRWCSPFTDVYRQTGFILDGVTAPSYWYVKGRERFHKFNFRKGRLAKRGVSIEGKTEREIMQELGYQRIYDCGLYRYVKTYDF